MRTDQLMTKLVELSNNYLAFEDNAVVLVRQLKKTIKADVRNKLIGELRNIEKKRLDLLKEIEDLTTS